jgi:hypothetical protein
LHRKIGRKTNWNDRTYNINEFEIYFGFDWFTRVENEMGRPRASDTIRDFAAMFTATVSVPSNCQYDWIARTGKHGVFSLLMKLAPKVRVEDDDLHQVIESFHLVLSSNLSRLAESSATRTSTGSHVSQSLLHNADPYLWLHHPRNRRGISEPELNKHLESLGFRRTRVRLRCIVRYVGSPHELG